MMPLSIDVPNLLAANSLGVIGTTLFEGQMPDTAIGLLLNEYGSEPPTFVVGPQTPGVYIEQPRFQIYCRHTDYATGRALIESAYELLSTIVNQLLGTTLYLRIEPLQSPFSVNPPQDAVGRWEWMVNFRVMKEVG